MMNLAKKVSCLIFLLMFVFILGSAEYNKESRFRGEKVDEIYESIRYGGPVYNWEERLVTFENEGMTLVCTLVLPMTGQKCPVVLILNGFAGDRKEVMIPETSEYFWERLSRMLAEQGLSSLRIDFRGSGDSDGEYDMTTFSTQISDALAALTHIRRKLRWLVDWRNIGILGLSQGGLVAASTAARDNRVDSVVLWSPVSHPPIVYEGLLTKAGLKQGLALAEGGSSIFPIYVNDEYVNWDVPLGKGFFEDLYRVDPVAEVYKNYSGPLMAVCGSQDPIIWPQPLMSNLYLTHHEGFEKLVVINADHAFNWWEGPEPEKLHDAIYWSAAWFLYTLD
jgi:pimeloyl-ACP methyl ester carboxylesterase